MNKLRLGVMSICFLLVACQQKIEFTPSVKPTLPTFETENTFPIVKPDWTLLNNQEHIISTSIFSVSDGVHIPITVYQIKSVPNDNWHVKLIGINSIKPVANADVLVRAFRRKALSVLNSDQNDCLESLSASASYHSISVEISCPIISVDQTKELGRFWNSDLSGSIDVDTIRRNLKLNSKLQSVTGSDIELVFQQHLLGNKHPYLNVVQDSAFIEELDNLKLKKLHSQTASQLEWHLLIKAPQKLTPEHKLEVAKRITSQMNLTSGHQDHIVLDDIKPKLQTKTIYFIDAPNSSDIKVRIGMRFPQYFDNNKLVSKSNDQWPSEQKSYSACQTLSGILGRRSYGRLCSTIYVKQEA